MSNSSPASASTDGDTLGILWGVEAISRAIGRTKNQTYHMLERGYLPGRKAGRIWTSTREALLEALAPEKVA